MDAHSIPRDVLERFAANTATREEKTAVARHLFTGCPECTRRLELKLQRRAPENEDRQEEPYEKALDRCFGRVTSLLAAEPRELLEELESHPLRRQETMARNHPRFREASLCDLLIERSRAARHRDPKSAFRSARLALLVASQLDGVPGEVLERRARAWATLGNAYRLQGDFLAAEKALQEAHKLAVAGDCDERLRAYVLSLWGSLRFDQRRFEESVRFCRDCGAIHRRLGDAHEAGRALIQEGTALGESGRPGPGVRLLIEAARMIDIEREPTLALIAGHNIVRFYTDAGRTRDAMQLYLEMRDLYRQVNDPLIQLKAIWLEGQMLAAEAHPEPALTLLLRARSEFLRLGMTYEAALASLDLAAAFAKLGRFSALRDLVGRILPIFKALGVHREAIASALLLRQSTDASAALQIIRSMAAQVKKTTWVLQRRAD
ncbi:MAG TPA: tetratricopeptide repeat protein [Thermoanaerobaculia bacterium]|nr:tetratricopeptide repeat protein [Thermoanaerobaculia bacterium]